MTSKRRKKTFDRWSGKAKTKRRREDATKVSRHSERYPELIDAADTITEMSRSSADVSYAGQPGMELLQGINMI